MRKLTHSELLKLKRWNTPTIYNGWEQITSRNSAKECFNIEEVTDFMPQMGPMIGYAITVVVEPANPQHPKDKPDGWAEYREYVASIKGPKIVVVQDLDKPRTVGAFWGEVNANVHKALGCVGSIIDSGIRDVDEMTNAGFKTIAHRLCVGHANSWPVKWNCDVEVFGTAVKPGQLIHADKHGFLVIPDEDQQSLLEAATFMDANENETFLAATRSSSGKSTREILDSINKAGREFNENVKKNMIIKANGSLIKAEF
jgi:4-hydroxy-4-methyl-2-oxoglutarate aldolase